MRPEMHRRAQCNSKPGNKAFESKSIMQNERVKRARLDKLSRQVPPWVAGILVCLLLTAFRGPDASAQTSAPSTNSPPNGALISFELIRGHIVVTARAND